MPHLRPRLPGLALLAALLAAPALAAQTPLPEGAPGPRLIGVPAFAEPVAAVVPPPVAGPTAPPEAPVPADDPAYSLAAPPFDAPATAAAPAAGMSGRSGALHVAILPPGGEAAAFAAALDGEGYRWLPLLGTRTEVLGEPAFATEIQPPGAPGVWRLEARPRGPDDALRGLTVVTLVPHALKSGGRLNGYHIGTYPTEGSDGADRYAPPAAFIEVTPENQDMHLSDHFQVRQFLTKDQDDVWPKYLALDLRLLDKLELVLQELAAMGVRADAMHVMSGFRTPQYNGPGGDGRAALSRHMYGDAADVWVDSDRNGWIDDLNGDGRTDFEDVRVMLRAVERVERRHPELVGGAGVYNATVTHGPFIHIDVRGTPSRW